MLIDTLLTFFVIRYRWHYKLVPSLLATAFFVVVDIAFFSSSLTKIGEGGWFPLSIAFSALFVMLTWRRGREIVVDKMKVTAIELEPFLKSLLENAPYRCPGTGVFLVANPNVVPRSLLHNLSHNKVLHERVVFLTVTMEEDPTVAPEERVSIEAFRENCWRVRLRFGFMERPDVPQALELCAAHDLGFNMMETSFFLSREKIISTPGEGMAQWREHLFATMVRNAGSAVDYFHLPPNRVIELGTQIEI
jgi:KUP system potassium uptake protein